MSASGAIRHPFPRTAVCRRVLPIARLPRWSGDCQRESMPWVRWAACRLEFVLHRILRRRALGQPGSKAAMQKIPARWDRAARDERYSSAIEYVYYQWTPQAVTDDVNDMQQQAPGVIERAAEEDGHDA